MLKARVGLLFLSLITGEVFATDSINPKQFLLNQVLWGEVYYRDDFVKHSLYPSATNRFR